MKIFELCLGHGLGGLELYFHKCCTWLENSEHELISITSKESRLSELLKQDNFNNLELDKAGRFPLLTALKLAKLISEYKIDLVHVHHKDDLPLIAWTKLFCRRKFKLVHTRQMQFPRNKKNPYHDFIYKKIDLLITITDKLKATVLKNTNLKEHQVTRLYYGVESNTDTANCEELKKGLAHDFTVGVFSRIEHQKGQHLVVDAITQLKTKGINANVLMVGDIMDQNYYNELLERIKKNKVEENINFKGFQKNPIAIMKCCNAVVMPSKNETFGLVLIEAMRAGIATIGTNSGGVPEILDHDRSGLMFEWGDLKDLSNQIEKLYDSDFRKTIASAGKKKADAMFNHETHFNKLMKLFENTLMNELKNSL
jgi:glycosyltransferase involved in cell wall biosynthesis